MKNRLEGGAKKVEESWRDSRSGGADAFDRISTGVEEVPADQIEGRGYDQR